MCKRLNLVLVELNIEGHYQEITLLLSKLKNKKLIMIHKQMSKKTLWRLIESKTYNSLRRNFSKWKWTMEEVRW